MGFFDEIVDAAWLIPGQTDPPSDPPWLGPPCDTVPQRCDVEIEFVRARDIALWMSGAAVFPSGVALTLEIRWGADHRVGLPVIPGERGRSGLCLGARFDDGHRILAAPRRRQSSKSSRTLVVAPLRARPQLATVEVWLWPLPEVSLAWIVEWRAQGIRETAVRWDTSSLREAARQTRPVWLSPAALGVVGRSD
jgi:hypothetical protein